MSSSDTSIPSRSQDLNRYLYDCNNVVDRLMQAPQGHTLRHGPTQTQPTLGVDANRDQSKQEERRDAAAVARLERDMNVMTDARLLRTSRNDLASKSMSLYLVIPLSCRFYVSSSFCLIVLLLLVPMSRRPYILPPLYVGVLGIDHTRTVTLGHLGWTRPAGDASAWMTKPSTPSDGV